MELAEQNAQLVGLTRRAVVMESQVDVLNGKAKVLKRYRDGLAGTAAELRAMADDGGYGAPARRAKAARAMTTPVAAGAAREIDRACRPRCRG